MDNVMNVLSKFKTNLGSFIDDYKNKIKEIEKEEEFIRTLGDVINYSKEDVLQLPFYDETILSRIIERVFPLSTNEINKLKTAKYLIEASKSIDKTHFLQYNNAVKDVEEIYESINEFYEKMLSDNSLKTNKEQYNYIVDSYSTIYNKIEEEGFNDLISDIDLLEQTLKCSELESNEINTILNIIIKDNLKYLDQNGTIKINTNEPINIFQDEIYDLSKMLGEE